MAAFISPFRIVSAADSVAWEPTIEDVNKRRWDYAELHRLVGGMDVGLPAPYRMVVARDGAVGLPVLPPTKDIYSATEQFNQCFAALLVGGVYCEAIIPTDSSLVSSSTGNTSAFNQAHKLRRTCSTATCACRWLRPLRRPVSLAHERLR
jgi:hypothetical protein